MFTLFAHAGHVHDMESMSGIYGCCMPIIVGAGIVIAVLVGIIIYLLAKCRTEGHAHNAKTTKAAKKK